MAAKSGLKCWPMPWSIIVIRGIRGHGRRGSAMSFFPERQQNERRTYEPAAEQLERALRAIEYHRHGLDLAADDLQRLLCNDADLSKLWSNFTMAGGIFASDLSNFIAGRFRYRR